MDSHHIWAAGFFEGEGSITHHGRARVLQVTNTDEEAIRRFASAIGAGHVYGPYTNRQGDVDGYERSPVYHWVARGAVAQRALDHMWSWLTEKRRRRAVELGFLAPLHVERAA